MSRQRGSAHLAVLVAATFGSTAFAVGAAAVGAASDLVGIAAIIAALTGAYTSYKTNRVHKELKVFNSMTPGEQIDATTIARLEAIPRPERTRDEQEHLDDAPPKDPPQGPAGSPPPAIQ